MYFKGDRVEPAGAVPRPGMTAYYVLNSSNNRLQAARVVLSDAAGAAGGSGIGAAPAPSGGGYGGGYPVAAATGGYGAGYYGSYGVGEQAAVLAAATAATAEYGGMGGGVAKPRYAPY